MTKQELQEKIDNLNNNIKEIYREIGNIKEKQDERFDMLKEYLGVKEEDYAILEEENFSKADAAFFFIKPEIKPIKKTRLIKKKAGRPNKK